MPSTATLRWRLVAILFLAVLSVSTPSPAATQDSWDGVERIVAIGDIHGDFDQFVTILKAAGMVDNKLNWKGGNAHLVQTGDVPDRGPKSRQILDLLMKLEKQAEKSKGEVHALIGNHDAMNVYGDLRYTTPEEYAEFRDSDSPKVRDAFFKEQVKDIKAKAKAAGTEPDIGDAFRAKWYDEHPLGWFEHRLAWGTNGKYGKWVREHNSVIRINDTLFVHGGISPKYADIPPTTVNERIREELNDFAKLQGGFTTDSEGPLWYRGLAEKSEKELEPQVDALLQAQKARRIVIGHTPTVTTVVPRVGARVIMIDVGMSKIYGGPPACLLIEGGTAYALHRGKKLAIPSGGGEALLEYYKSAAAEDPQPSRIQKLINALQTKPEPAAVR